MSACSASCLSCTAMLVGSKRGNAAACSLLRCRCECGQPGNMAAAVTVGPLHQARPCSSVHHAAHAGHGTLQIPAGPPGCVSLPARALLHGAGMPAQVFGRCTRRGLGGQAFGGPLLPVCVSVCGCMHVVGLSASSRNTEGLYVRALLPECSMGR